jgi:hypothetical protein
MATTNLISKSLGDILTESGNGTPDHTSPRGSLYVDIDSGRLYQNMDGSTLWTSFSTVAYGHGYYQDNATTTTIGGTNTWTAVGNNLTEGDSVGFSASTDTLVVIDGYGGEYEINGEVTIDFVTGTNGYEVGVSINGVNPAGGTYNGATIDTTIETQTIGFEAKVTLSDGDTIELAIRNITSANNVVVKHAQLFIRRLD